MTDKSSSSSSSGKSSNCEKNVKDFLREFDRTTIKTCVVGISSILFSKKIITHAALFLSDKDATKFDKYGVDDIEGIIIEYGGYDPNIIKGESDAVDNGYVIYRYGKYFGGLRYYFNKFEIFKKELGNVVYIALEVRKDNQVSFSYLLDKIAPTYDYKWTRQNYVLTDVVILNKFNCRTFVKYALDEIKPIYDKRLIKKGKKTEGKSRKGTGEDYIPKEILETLENYTY